MANSPRNSSPLPAAVLCLLASGLSACAMHSGGYRMMARAQATTFIDRHASELTIDQEELLGQLCPFGTPQHLDTWNHGHTEYVVRDGYALEFSSSHKIPLWVCERFEPAHMDGAFKRKDKFLADPQLSGPQSTKADYHLSGYARGHHAPAENHAWDERLLAETFYLSNMSPQVGAFNSGIWRSLETLARKSSANGQHTWIITGAMLYDPDEDDLARADGWIPYYAIGDNVTVPTHLFKVLVQSDADGVVSAVAYVIPNAKPLKNYVMNDYRRPIRWIELRTGFDFLPELSAEVSDDLEDGIGEFPRR